MMIFMISNSQLVSTEEGAIPFAKSTTRTHKIIFWGIPGGLTRKPCPPGQVYKRNRCRIMFK